MTSFMFLVNPLSGGGSAPKSVEPVAELLRQAGADVDIAYSPGPRATVDLVDAAVGRGDVVVGVGGDGTVSSIAGEVAERDGVLGLLPAGRGNDFARMLGLSHDPAEIARNLLTGTPTPTDLVRVTLPGGSTRIVAGSVYTGVDARAAATADRLGWLPTRLQYPVAGVHAFATYVPTDFVVAVDDVSRTYRGALVVVANSGYYGKGMHVAPHAAADDGLLDVIVIEAASRRSLITAMPTVYDGSHVDLDLVTELRGRVIRLSGTPTVPMGGDGEPLGNLPPSAEDPAVVEVLPGALSVLR